MTSSSSLVDAFIATLKSHSASVYNDQNVSKNDFGLLDTTTSGCVLIVLPGGFDSRLGTYGDPSTQFPTWRLNIRSFVKDTGNSVETLNRVWQVEKDLRATMNQDDTLGGSAMSAILTNGGGWDGNSFIGSETGVVWIPQNFTLQVVQVDV